MIDLSPRRRDRWCAAAIGIATGVAAWAFHRGQAALGSPAPCPGALDALAVLAGRLLPSAPIGIWLLRANALILASASGLTTILLQRCSGSWLVAGAAGLALAAQPWMAPAISVLDAVPLLVAAITFIAFVQAVRRAHMVDDHSASRGWSAVAFSALLATAIVIPAAGLPLGLLAGWHAFNARTGEMASRRWLFAIAMVGAVLIVARAFPAMLPGFPPRVPPTLLSACLFPPAKGSNSALWLDGLRSVLTSAGLYALSLAVLGAYALASRLVASETGPARRLMWSGLAYALVPTLVPRAAGQPLVDVFPTLLIAFWMCIGVGLKEVLRACTTQSAGTLGAAVFLLLLPTFQFVGLQPPVSPPPTFGLEQVSLRGFSRLFAVLPDHSLLVENEDSVTSTLLRALNGSWQRMGKQIGIADPDPDSLNDLASSAGTRVFALPPTQSRLQWLGLRMRDGNLPGISGVAEVAPGGRCLRIGPRWLEVPALASSQTRALSVVGLKPGEGHNSVLYLASRLEPHPAVIDWPSGVEPSVDFLVFDRTKSADEQKFAVWRQFDEAPADVGSMGPFVVRVGAWRFTNSPQSLPIDLGVFPIAVLARGAADSGTEGLVCPAFPYKPEELRTLQQTSAAGRKGP